MRSAHPIVITECPKCGAMKAARSQYLEHPKGDDGKPDPQRVWMMKIECFGCTEITPGPLPNFGCMAPSLYPSAAIGRFPGC